MDKDGVSFSSAVIVHQQPITAHPYHSPSNAIHEGVQSLSTALPHPPSPLISAPSSSTHSIPASSLSGKLTPSLVVKTANHTVNSNGRPASTGLYRQTDCQILLNPTVNIVPSDIAMASSSSNSATSHQTQLAIATHLTQHPVLKSFLAGSLSGTCSTLLFQPFDLVKTRIQNANFALNAANTGIVSTAESVPNRVFPILFSVVKNEQLLGLWKGTLPSLMRCVPGVGLHFCCLDTLQNHFCDGRKPTATEAFMFGSASRSIAGVLLIPVTVIKTRYESGVFVYKSLTDAVRHTYKSEGARGLTSGLLPTLARDVPFSGLYYMFYSQLKSAVSPLLVDESNPQRMKSSILTSSFVTFFCGMNAGLLASVVTQPMDVVKTHMQLYPKRFPSSFKTVILILKNKGPQGLFAGLVPRMLRRTLVASMTWTVFEHMMKNLGLNFVSGQESNTEIDPQIEDDNQRARIHIISIQKSADDDKRSTVDVNNGELAKQRIILFNVGCWWILYASLLICCLCCMCCAVAWFTPPSPTSRCTLNVFFYQLASRSGLTTLRNGISGAHRHQQRAAYYNTGHARPAAKSTTNGPNGTSGSGSGSCSGSGSTANAAQAVPAKNSPSNVTVPDSSKKNETDKEMSSKSIQSPK